MLSTRPISSLIGDSCVEGVRADNPSCIVPNHVYVVEKLEDSGQGDVTLHLRNPWGQVKTQPPPFKFSDLTKSFAFVDVGSP